MKHWTMTFRVEPPNEVVSARSGGSVFFAAYSRILRQWYLIANGTEEKIDPPEMLFLDEEYVVAHPAKVFLFLAPTKKSRHPRPPAQLSLQF